MVYVKKNNLKIKYYPVNFYNDNKNNQFRYILKQKYNNIIHFLSKRRMFGEKYEFYIKQKKLYI